MLATIQKHLTRCLDFWTCTKNHFCKNKPTQSSQNFENMRWDHHYWRLFSLHLLKLVLNIIKKHSSSFLIFWTGTKKNLFKNKLVKITQHIKNMRWGHWTIERLFSSGNWNLLNSVLNIIEKYSTNCLEVWTCNKNHFCTNKLARALDISRICIEVIELLEEFKNTS